MSSGVLGREEGRAKKVKVMNERRISSELESDPYVMPDGRVKKREILATSALVIA